MKFTVCANKKELHLYIYEVEAKNCEEAMGKVFLPYPDEPCVPVSRQFVHEEVALIFCADEHGGMHYIDGKAYPVYESRKGFLVYENGKRFPVFEEGSRWSAAPPRART